MGRDSLSANPLEAARKKAKQRQLQKNKEQRSEQRQFQRQHQTPQELHTELTRLKQRQSQLELQHKHDPSVNVNSGHVKEQIAQLQKAYDAALQRQKHEREAQQQRQTEHVTVRGVGGLAAVFGGDDEQRSTSVSKAPTEASQPDSRLAAAPPSQAPYKHPFENIIAVPPGLDKPPVPLHLRMKAAAPNQQQQQQQQQVRSQQQQQQQQQRPPPVYHQQPPHPPPPPPQHQQYGQHHPAPPPPMPSNIAPYQPHIAPLHFHHQVQTVPTSYGHPPPPPPQPGYLSQQHHSANTAFLPHYQQRQIDIQSRSQHRRREADLNDPLNTANPNYTGDQRATINTLAGRPPPPVSHQHLLSQSPAYAAADSHAQPSRHHQLATPAQPSLPQSAPGLGISNLQKVNPSALAATKLTPTNIAVKRTQHPSTNDQHAPQLLRQKIASINAAPDV